jgi:hypothetical protein
MFGFTQQGYLGIEVHMEITHSSRTAVYSSGCSGTGIICTHHIRFEHCFD